MARLPDRIGSSPAQLLLRRYTEDDVAPRAAAVTAFLFGMCGIPRTRPRPTSTATRAVNDYIVDLAVGVGQPCRVASWTSCTREVRPSLV